MTGNEANGFSSSDSDDDIPLFLVGLDIPVRVCQLLQGIAPVYDGPELPCLNQFFEEHHILSALTWRPEYHLLAASHRSPLPSNRV